VGVKDIFKSSSVTNLIGHLKSIPSSAAAGIHGVVIAKTQEERLELLKKMPEDVLRKLLKVITYMFLSSGVLLKESIHEVYLTPEIKEFFDKVKTEVDRIGELSMNTVSAAVDAVIGAATAALYLGVVALGVFCILNPPVGLAIGGVALFVDLLMLLPQSNEERNRRDQ
jgi:predicted PurR-regulated permease PerM